MLIEVMNRTQAEQTIFSDNTLVISISNKNQLTPKISANNILFLNFDDEEKPNTNAMTELDAKKIINIINILKNDIHKIIVHCGAGVSRSAGVAGALGKWLNNDDSFIFDNPKYCPNRTCYRLVLNEAIGNINEEELNKIFLHNEEIWMQERSSIL